ncbi:MAG: hypothetical protein JXB04_09365 [Kiritimatiellae bacterium]|nr:hypothetical protein [Kiritimatiellia bacterium]
MKSTCLSAVLLVLLAAAPTRAGLFGSKDDKAGPEEPKVQYKYHLHIPDKTTEKEFVDLFQQKRMLNEDLVVLSRLGEEKLALYAEAQKLLLNEFAVLPDKMYQYDRDTRTIYELVPEPHVLDVHDEPAPEAGDAPQAPQGSFLKKSVQQFADETQSERFLDLLRQKKLIHNELTVLRALGVQKQLALKRVNDQLQSKFNLKPDGAYRYDAAEMALYEILPAGR